MKEKSFVYEQNEEKYQTVRLGIKQHTIAKDIDKCCVLTINKLQNNHPQYAFLTNHEIVYLFDHKFGINKQSSTQMMLSQLCETKINLRMEYKLPSMLHIKMKYSFNLQCVFLMLTNSQIAVFNDEFYLIGLVDIVCCDPQNSIKYCLDYEYYEKEPYRSVRKIKNGYFVFLFSDYLQLHQVEMSTNHKLSNFKPSYKFSLIQIRKQIAGSHIKHPSNLTLFSFFRSHHFTKSTQKLNTHMVLSVNCLKEATFFLINKDTMKFQQTIRISKTHLNGSHLMDMDVSVTNKRILLALNNGTVKAVSFKQETYNQIIYTIKICQSSIMKIYLQSLQKLLSYSKDNTLSIINLYTLSVEQKFRIGDCIQFVFINQHYFVSIGNKSHSIYNNNNTEQEQFSRLFLLNEFNCNYQKIFECNSDIVSFLLQEKREIIQLSDNSLLINQHNEKSISVIQTYLPPRSVSVKCIHKNPFKSIDQYWILTQKSEIYKYNVSSSNEVNVSEVIELYRFMDKNQTEHRYIVSYFCFLTKIVPMQYDTETTQKQYKKNQQSNEQIKPICLGTTTGQVLIVSIDSIFNIICRMRSISTLITNIIEVHPISSSKLSKGLIIYESKKCQKAIITELGPANHPIQHYRIDSRNGQVKQINNELFAIINNANFCVFYTRERSNQIDIYREQHYNPGSSQNAKITSLSYSKNKQIQFILAGFSMGQIFIYRLSHNINESTYIHLSLLYLIENSKEEPIQFTRFDFDSIKVYFNFGSFLIGCTLPEIQMKSSFSNIDNNYKLDKNRGGKQFNFSQRKETTKKVNIQTMKLIQQSQELKLPKIKVQKIKSNRSSSVGVLKSDRTQLLKADFMFHFPDIQLYRSLIKKNIIK